MTLTLKALVCSTGSPEFFQDCLREYSPYIRGLQLIKTYLCCINKKNTPLYIYT